MTPTPMLFVLLVMIGLGGWLVVATRDPLRQAIVVSMYGLLLAVLFFALQAPDVALSQIVVGSVALPLMLLLAMVKIREQPEQGEGKGRRR
jgi:energy-converting hydrogenase B subunit D